MDAALIRILANEEATLSKTAEFPQCTQRLDAERCDEAYGTWHDINWHARLGLSCDIVNHHVHLDRRLCLTGHYLARRRRGSFFAQLALALVLLTRLILALVRSSSAQPDLVLPEV